MRGIEFSEDQRYVRFKIEWRVSRLPVCDIYSDSKLHGNLSEADSIAKNRKRCSYKLMSENGSLAI